jgi:hypothetical protein
MNFLAPALSLQVPAVVFAAATAPCHEVDVIQLGTVDAAKHLRAFPERERLRHRARIRDL